MRICCSYETATNDAVLKQNFAGYLRSSFGRQGIKNMSEVTVGLYVSSLFSLTQANSFKQYLRRTSGFNPDFELQELMFRPNIPIYIQESIFKKGVLPGPASGLEPSQSSCTASALLKLLEYFLACESQMCEVHSKDPLKPTSHSLNFE